MRLKLSGKLVRPMAYVVVLAGIGIGAWFIRERWLPLIVGKGGDAETAQTESPPIEEAKVLKLSEQARANLGLVSKPASVQSYWRTIQIPGVITDRPGMTDSGITSPIAGVITRVHAFEGDIIRPGDKLFTIRLISEYLQQAQSDLFKAIRETDILNTEKARLGELARMGAIPGNRIIELDQQISRQAGLIDAQRQDLLARGLEQNQIDQIELGEFLVTIDIHAPLVGEPSKTVKPVGFVETSSPFSNGFFEIQDLKVALGQQVIAGEALAVLANHSSLYVQGHAFRKEASSIARVAENGVPVEIVFAEDTPKDWPALSQEFQIRHLANTTDPNSRTFEFFIPLTNQSRLYEKDDRKFVIWRFRPGQRVSLRVPVEELKDVIVLPAGAVVHEGPEAWVFQQNGDLFNRISVQVIHQDRSSVVIANDKNITPGFYLAQGSAASLNRVLKAQAASGMRADVHVHADGTTHAAH